MSTEAKAAAERLIGSHRRYEGTETGEDGQSYPYECCEVDDEDWPCDAAYVAEALLDAANA